VDGVVSGTGAIVNELDDDFSLNNAPGTLHGTAVHYAENVRDTGTLGKISKNDSSSRDGSAGAATSLRSTEGGHELFGGADSPENRGISWRKGGRLGVDGTRASGTRVTAMKVSIGHGMFLDSKVSTYFYQEWEEVA